MDIGLADLFPCIIYCGTIVGLEIVYNKMVGCCKFPDVAHPWAVSVVIIDLVNTPIISFSQFKGRGGEAAGILRLDRFIYGGCVFIHIGKTGSEIGNVFLCRTSGRPFQERIYGNIFGAIGRIRITGCEAAVGINPHTNVG